MTGEANASARTPDDASGVDRAASIVLRLASELHLGGQDTDHTVRAAERLAHRLGIDGVLLPGWDRVELLMRGEGRPTRVEVRDAVPVAVQVRRVSALMAQGDALSEGRAKLDGAEDRIAAAAALGPPPAWALAAAAAAGACALAAIFGETALSAFESVAAVAGLGGMLRRRLGDRNAGLLTQDAAAAFLAGLGAGLAARAGLSGDLRLIALCPCMILIPGPHLLNGVADLLLYRVTLGASRLVFAAMALAAITVGLLLGLAVVGQTLPLGPTHASVPLWRDVIAGGIAAACYGVFYAMPAPMLAWPAAAGVAAHAVHWFAQVDLGIGPAPAAAAASVVAGGLLSPVTRRYHLPFAGVGFASVVSMLPGIFLFPMGGALVAIGQRGAASSPALVAGAAGDGMTALLVVLGITLGLLGPKALFDAWRRSPAAVVLPLSLQET